MEDMFKLCLISVLQVVLKKKLELENVKILRETNFSWNYKCVEEQRYFLWKGFSVNVLSYHL